MTQFPDWVLKHKTKGIAIEHRNGRYYATRVTSVWDPEKHRARKITQEYLGVVTPEGIIPPKHKRPKKVTGVIEAGHIVYLTEFMQGLETSLKRFWPVEWESILAAGVLKLIYGNYPGFI